MGQLLSDNKSEWVIWLAWLVVASFFCLDLLIPLDMAIGTLYVIVIFMLAQTGRYDRLAFFASLSIGLIIIDMLVDGPAGLNWSVLANRLMSMLAIGIAAALLLQQKQLRDQDRTRDLLFRKLLDSAPDAVVIVNDRGRIELANQQVEVLFGYRKNELIGRNVEVLMPGRFADRHQEYRNGYFRAPVTRTMGRNIDLRAIKKDGREFPVEISLSPLETAQGLLVSAAIRDVSERREAEAKFRNLLESAPDAMVIVGESGLIELANRQTETLFEHSQEELIGQPIEILLPERFQDKHSHHRESYFHGPKVRGMGRGLELFGLKKSGVEFPVEVSLSPLETRQGLLVSAAIRDISERKEKERELNLYAGQLESKNEELEQFAYIASHDLQEPLRTVSSFVDLLADEYGEKLQGNAEVYLDYISSASQRMTHLIKGLLEYSRIGRHSTLERIDCGEVMADLIRDLNAVIEESGATITVGEMPTIATCGSELRQLLQNLVSNAIKFRKSGLPPRVNVTARKQGSLWHFVVSDNGIGIEKDFQERIFMIFQRLHTTEQYEGTGIGLAHARKIADLLGGRLWVESEWGHGSDFQFTIADRTDELVAQRVDTKAEADPGR